MVVVCTHTRDSQPSSRGFSICACAITSLHFTLRVNKYFNFYHNVVVFLNRYVVKSFRMGATWERIYWQLLNQVLIRAQLTKLTFGPHSLEQGHPNLNIPISQYWMTIHVEVGDIPTPPSTPTSKSQ